MWGFYRLNQVLIISFFLLWLALGLVVGLSWVHGIRTVSCFLTIDTVSRARFLLSSDSNQYHFCAIILFSFYFLPYPDENSQHNRNYMFPFVGLMKLSFISCFLIAIGVSIAIVINPLSNELQGAWIVSIMGTGLYRSVIYQWNFAPVATPVTKKSIIIVTYRLYLFSFVQYSSGILRLLCTHYTNQWKWRRTTINRIWWARWTMNMLWVKMWFKQVPRAVLAICNRSAVAVNQYNCYSSQASFGLLQMIFHLFKLCGIFHVEFDTSAINLSINEKSFIKSL